MRAIISVMLCSLFWACTKNQTADKRLDTPTSGQIKVAVDESLLPLADAEAQAFEGIYKNAKVDLVYTTEQQAIDLLLKDSVKLIVITRSLVGEEAQALVEQKLKAHQVKIAIGGVALIVHPSRVDSLITINELRSILSGKTKFWGKAEASKSTAIQVVFDQPNSGILRYLQDSLPFSSTIGKHCFAVKSNAAVVEHVSSHKNALGLIDVSWISDRDDSISHAFLKTVKVLALKKDDSYCKPYQGYLAQKQYPLVRDITMISREARAGLASGFIAFAASDKGQRVVLKAGLVPATMPVRIVQINNQSLE